MKTPRVHKPTDRLVSLDGITRSLVEWCQLLNHDYGATQKRLERGWPEELALIRPTNKPFTRPKGSIGKTGKTLKGHYD